MVTFIADAAAISVPEGVVDIESFRRWTDTDDFPEQGRIWWLKGEVWVDLSREQIFTHLAVKNEFSFVLTGLVKAGALGLFVPDGLLLSNFAADICGNPDATFIAQETLRSDRVRLIEGADGGYVELQGTPDMVLEVISRTCQKRFSKRKGTPLYRAKLPEDKALSVLAHLQESCGVRQTGRLVGVNKNTVIRLAVLAGQHAKELHDERVGFSPQHPRSAVR